MTKLLAQPNRTQPRVNRGATPVSAHAATALSADGVNNTWLHMLPLLPYGYAALEPAIDRQSLKLHHSVHHKAYVKQLNQALLEYPALQRKSAQWLLLNLELIPTEIRQKIKNSAGGHVNHSLFWQAMSPQLSDHATGGVDPTGQLADAIAREFSSLDFFKTLFTNTAVSVFGSGWVWLVRTQEDDGRLELITTEGHDNPMAQGYYPLLLCDVWEHAYYLQYKNSRREYLEQWWHVVNWREVERRYAEAKHRAAALPQVSKAPKLLTQLWRHAA